MPRGEDSALGGQRTARRLGRSGHCGMLFTPVLVADLKEMQIMRNWMIAALAAGSLLPGLAASQATQALPLAKAPGSAAASMATVVRRGRGWRGGDRMYRGFYGAPFVGYGAYYGGGYYEGCHWIRRRAQATGSRYWWTRYEDCIVNNY